MDNLYAYQETLIAREKILAEMETILKNSDLHQVKHDFDRQKKIFLDLRHQADLRRSDLSRHQQRTEDLRGQLQEVEQKLYGGEVSNARELSTYQDKEGELKERIARSEKEERELQADINHLEEKRRHVGVDLKKIQQEFNLKKEALLATEHSKAEELASVDKELELIGNNIDESRLTWFLKERKNYDGRLLAKIVRGGVCNACHRMIPQATVMRYENGIADMRCDNCNRLLTGDED